MKLKKSSLFIAALYEGTDEVTIYATQDYDRTLPRRRVIMLDLDLSFNLFLTFTPSTPPTAYLFMWSVQSVLFVTVDRSVTTRVSVSFSFQTLLYIALRRVLFLQNTRSSLFDTRQPMKRTPVECIRRGHTPMREAAIGKGASSMWNEEQDVTEGVKRLRAIAHK